MSGFQETKKIQALKPDLISSTDINFLKKCLSIGLKFQTEIGKIRFLILIYLRRMVLWMFSLVRKTIHYNMGSNLQIREANMLGTHNL
jgi:hypothetical protein